MSPLNIPVFPNFPQYPATDFAFDMCPARKFYLPVTVKNRIVFGDPNFKLQTRAVSDIYNAYICMFAVMVMLACLLTPCKVTLSLLCMYASPH